MELENKVDKFGFVQIVIRRLSSYYHLNEIIDLIVNMVSLCVCVCVFYFESVSEFGVFSHLSALNTWSSDGRRHRLTQRHILYKCVNSHNEIDSSFSS